MAPRFGLARKVREAARTVTHSAQYARNLLRGNRVAGDLSWMQEGAAPVLLAHGFMGTRGTMVPLRRRFQADGRVVFTYHHGRFQLASIRRSAQELVDHLRGLEQTLHVGKIDVVGFSMGGLTALHAIKFLQGHQYIRRLALLGTPVQGTWTCLAGVATVGLISSSVWQCLPGSQFLDELHSAPLPEGFRVRQIHADTDAFCPTSAPIGGIDREHDYLVLPGGHSSLCVSQSFYAKLREFFDEPDPQVDIAEPAIAS